VRCLISSTVRCTVLYCTDISTSPPPRVLVPPPIAIANAPRAIPLSLSLCPHSFRFPRHRPCHPLHSDHRLNLLFRSQPWSTRSPIRRNLASVRSNGFRAAPVSLTVRCSPFWLLYYIPPLVSVSPDFSVSCFSPLLVLCSSTFLSFHCSPLVCFPFIITCFLYSPIFRSVRLLTLRSQGFGRSLVVYKCSACI